MASFIKWKIEKRKILPGKKNFYEFYIKYEQCKGVKNMKISATQSYPITQSTNSVTAVRPSFKQIKVVPRYWNSVPRVLRSENDVYKFVAIREDLTKVYIAFGSYYNMHFSLPTILQMLEYPEIYDVSVDCLHGEQ